MLGAKPGEDAVKSFQKWLRSFIVFIVSLSLTSCGTILYPERKGQRDGRLDIGIVLLDGIGLLFFIIPGVIAYAVDFTNGTIYLPCGGRAGLDIHGVKAVRFDPKGYTPELIKNRIRLETGYDLDWRDPRLRAIRLRATNEISVYFAQADEACRSDRVCSAANKERAVARAD